MLRHPAVADLFYPGDPDTLQNLLATFPRSRPQPIKAIGLVVPHAGYRYSGMVAASVFAATTLPSALILIGPNHRGAGAGMIPHRAALFGAGAWETPLGTMSVDDTLADLLLDEIPLLTVDAVAHTEEHALEVQLPLILHYAATPPAIVPIALGATTPDDIATIGEGMARAIGRYPGAVAMIASTDFSHYVPKGRARKDDRLALDQIEKLDPVGLLNVVRERHISMCGAGPVATVITAANALGATTGEVIDYRTSGDVTGDESSVVGYGGALIY